MDEGAHDKYDTPIHAALEHHHTDEDAPAALEAALRQLRDRDYAAELRDAGADPIHEIAIVVHGKRVLVAAAR